MADFDKDRDDAYKAVKRERVVSIPVVEALPGVVNAIRRWLGRGGWSDVRQLTISKRFYDRIRERGYDQPFAYRQKQGVGFTERTFFNIPPNATIRFLDDDKRSSYEWIHKK